MVKETNDLLIMDLGFSGTHGKFYRHRVNGTEEYSLFLRDTKNLPNEFFYQVMKIEIAIAIKDNSNRVDALIKTYDAHGKPISNFGPEEDSRSYGIGQSFRIETDGMVAINLQNILLDNRVENFKPL